MLALLLLTAGLVSACVVVGQAVLALCGWTRWRWWAPALGYGVLLILGGQALRIPGGAATSFVLIAIATVAALALSLVRAALRQEARESALLGVPLLLVAAIPFFAAGHTGVLGTSISNDMSAHLLGAFYVRTGDSLKPMAAIGGDILSTGYPMGPHGLAAALTWAFGVGEERAFAAVTLAVPVLTAFAALGLVPRARVVPRSALAAAVGLGYLPVAYLAQGSFKETIQSMLVFAGAVALGDLVREDVPGVRRALPLGVLAGSAVYTYSYGGVFWLVGAAGLLLVVELARDPRGWLRTLRRVAKPVAGAVAVGVLLALPEIGRIIDFTQSLFGVEPKVNRGNLFHAVNPLETLGVWLSGDFRINPDPKWPSLVLSVIALVALAGAIVWWVRRRALALPAAALTALVIWVEFALTRNIYNAAKGFVILAPLVMALIGAPLAEAWSADARRRGLLVAARVTGVVLFAAAAASSFSVLRSAPVGLGGHERELAAMRPLLSGKTVLFLTNDHFAQWELRGALLRTTGPLYAPAHLGMHAQKKGGAPIDVDNYGSADLDKVQFIVTPGGAYQSEVPPNFRLIRRSTSYELFQRAGPTPPREPLEPPGKPGAVADCNSQRARSYRDRYAWAGVLPRPVVSGSWQGSIGVPGSTARTTVELPRGRWDVSLQYLSRTPIDVQAPGLRTTIPASFGVVVAYWPAGTLTSDGGRVTLSLTTQKRSWFGRLIGGPRPMLAPSTPGRAPLWHVAFTRHDATPRRVSARSACGRYVDWFAPAGSAMNGRSAERDNAVRVS